VPGDRVLGHERVQKLHLVGFTTDREGLILSVRRGARSGSYVLAIDDAIEEAVDDLRARRAQTDDDAADAEAAARPPRVESALPVREIQARLRQGRTVAEVAKAAGVDEAWVERFAPPVLAERAQVITRVLGIPLRRARLGASRLPIGDAVRHHLADRGVALTADEFEGSWSAQQVSDGRWSVRFTFQYRGKPRTLRYDLDEATGEVSTTDRTSGQLGYVAPEPARAEGARAHAGAAVRPRAQRPVTSTGFRAETASGAPVSRSAREREKAAAAMRKAAAQRAAEAERATVRRLRQREQEAARAAREAARREKAEAARRDEEARAAAKKAADKVAAAKAAQERAAAKKVAAAKAAQERAAAKKVAAAKKPPAKTTSAKTASPAKAVAKAAATGSARPALAGSAPRKVSTAPKAAPRTTAAPVGTVPPDGVRAPEARPAASRTGSAPRFVKTPRNSSKAVPGPTARPGVGTARPVTPRTDSPDRSVQALPTASAPTRADVRPPVPQPSAPVRPAAPTPRDAPSSASDRPAVVPLPPRPQFRTGLVEPVGEAVGARPPATPPDGAPNGTAGPAARPVGRPRRTRPLRAT